MAGNRENEVNAAQAPSAEQVRAQVNRVCESRRFKRAPTVRQLLRFITEQWIADGGVNLTEKFIGAECLKQKPEHEIDGDKWGHPKARANMRQVRTRLRDYYETKGFHDPVTITLNVGSYIPVIAPNVNVRAGKTLDRTSERLILRAKTSLDHRSLRGALRAIDYLDQMDLKRPHYRVKAAAAFIPMAAGPLIPYATRRVRGVLADLLAWCELDGASPWESTFAHACGAACYGYRWDQALELFEKANHDSNGEAAHFWWYTALLASKGRVAEAIDIVDSAVTHFARTSIGARTDLAMLRTISGQYDDAEETLLGCLDFAPESHPAIACSFAMLYEAQDRLEDAANRLEKWIGTFAAPSDEGPAEGQLDAHHLIAGMVTLILSRVGAVEAANRWFRSIFKRMTDTDKTSSVEAAVALIAAGKKDDAVFFLTEAAKEGDPLSMWFHILPPLRHLRGHNGYRELLAWLRLPISGSADG